jgi:hypothetical protein
MRDGLGHDVEPRVELVVPTAADLDPCRRDPLGHTGEAEAEHVVERFEPVTPSGQQGADRRVDEMGELDLHGGAADGEGPLDLVEVGRTRDATEAEARDLVERRTLLGEARHAAGNRDHEAHRVTPSAARGLAAPGDELRSMRSARAVSQYRGTRSAFMISLHPCTSVRPGRHQDSAGVVGPAVAGYLLDGAADPTQDYTAAFLLVRGLVALGGLVFALAVNPARDITRARRSCLHLRSRSSTPTGAARTAER